MKYYTPRLSAHINPPVKERPSNERKMQFTSKPMLLATKLISNFDVLCQSVLCILVYFSKKMFF